MKINSIPQYNLNNKSTRNNISANSQNSTPAFKGVAETGITKLFETVSTKGAFQKGPKRKYIKLKTVMLNNIILIF